MNIEIHPFEPWLPADARLLMLGTFPPAPKRWCMPWYYPNFTNDMWRIFGLIFFGEKGYFVDNEHKTYRLEKIKVFLKQAGVALFDTAICIRRTKGTASDKDLEIVEQSDLDGMLRALPKCCAIVTAGHLATSVFTLHFKIKEPLQMGAYTEFMFDGRMLRLYRMPSSSRAYPMRLEQKAEYYAHMFKDIGILNTDKE